MRNISLLLVLALGFAFANARPVYLRIDHTQNGLPFDMSRVFPSVDGTYDMKVTSLRYYVSEVTVIHDGGKQELLTDVFLLVDAGKPTKFFLADLDVDNVERVVFSIGVPVFLNHNDPAKYPEGHPLGFQNPSMHWGWAAGYRFVAFEGLAGRGEAPSTVFQFHTLSDDLFTTTSVTTSAINSDDEVVIPVRAEVSQILNGIDATYGQIVHGATGDAITVMQNFGKNVFSAVVTSVEEQPVASLTATPNPSWNTVTLTAPELVGATVTIVDVTGQTVQSMQAASEEITMDVRTLAAGMYTVLVTRDGRPVARSPFRVVR
jgi:hypothetical protein